jgi:predicted outer membrane repeat protein
MKINGATFTGETATDGGGAVANYGLATITGSTLNGNSAGGQGGGGIFSNGTLILDTTTFSNDSATGTSDGGGVENLGVLTAMHSTFSGDTAANGRGGAIFNYGSAGNFAYAYLQNTSITGCTAEAGGGVFNQSTVILENGSVTGNTATAGDGGGIDNQATLTATGVFFSNDQATNGNGGGIANTGDGSVAGVASLVNCTVSDSSAVNGGAIFNQNNVLTIQSSTLFGDTATNDGGCVDNQSMLFAANATFTQNSAGNQGGAIYNNAAAKLVNCTIVANSATGGGGVATSGAGSDATLNNTIISQNTSGASASDILGSLNSGSSHNLVGTAGGTGATGGLLEGVNGNIVNVSNPLLSALQNNGGPDFTMAPLPGSAAIDAGDSSLAVDGNGNALMFDQRGLAGASAQGGTPRVVGSSVDIGAVEVGGYTLAPAPGSNPQHATVNTAFGHALTVDITSINGLDPVDGGVINFATVPGGNGQSASLAALASTVNLGAQTVTAVANNQTGAYFVNATVAGAVNTAQFQLTNDAKLVATTMVFTVEPSNAGAGGIISPAVQVTIEDQFGNVMASDNSSVTIAVHTGPSTALNGTLTVNAVNGVATFSDLSLNIAGTYTLGAVDSADSLTAVSTSFNIAASSAEQLVYLQQPTGTTAGSSITPAVVVAIEDQFGNILLTDDSNVTIAVNSGPSTALNGTLTVSAVNGIATFSNLSLNTAGTYTLNAVDSDDSLNVVSSSFTITASSPAQLVYTQQPTSAVAGHTIAPAVVVAIEDQFGNIITSDNASVTIAVNTGPSTALNGTLTVNAVNGVATFSNLSLNTAGVYTLFAADSADLINAVSSSFTISAAAAQQLVFVQQPTSTTANTVIAPAVTVAVEDQFGNLETADSSSVTIAINSGPAGATLAGTLTVNAVNGVATFSTLSLNTGGTYTLAASDAALAHAISGSFNITAVVSATGSASGTVYKDITGNGLSADDTALAGVVVKIYKDLNGNGVLDSSDGAPVATITSGADGTYSFTGLAPGKYIIAETVPTGDVETAPNLPDYYAVTVAASANTGNLNFDNFQVPNCPLQNVYYTINGSCTKITNLRGATAQGETVTVTFTVPSTSAPMVYSLVTYNAPDSVFNASDASQQTIYQDATGTFGPGTHTLTVTIPNNYYQIDFVCGAAIDKLGPAGSNIFYSAQNRLDSADNAGLHSDVDDESATMAFWSSLGQSLIKSFGGSSTSTGLGTWLATYMPNVFGGTALGNKTNATVASTYMSYYNVTGQKNMAQVMATAMNVYASTLSLGGSTGTSFGFNVTSAGLGAADFNIGSNGAAFGVSNNATITVTQMLSYVNSKASKNVLYNNVTSLLNQAYNEFGQVNGDGGID